MVAELKQRLPEELNEVHENNFYKLLIGIKFIHFLSWNKSIFSQKKMGINKEINHFFPKLISLACSRQYVCACLCVCVCDLHACRVQCDQCDCHVWWVWSRTGLFARPSCVTLGQWPSLSKLISLSMGWQSSRWVITCELFRTLPGARWGPCACQFFLLLLVHR